MNQTKHDTLAKYLCSLILLLVASTVNAGEFSHSGKISEIHGDGGYIIVKVDAAQVNPDACPSEGYYGLNIDSEKAERLFSMILTAQIAEKNVKFWIAGCEGKNNSYPGITSMKLFR